MSVTAQYAAPGDTWGIPGPTFLGWYIALAAISVVVAFVVRLALGGGRRSTVLAPDQEPDPELVGYLTGGERRAVYTAMAALRAQGLISEDGRGGVRGTRVATRVSELQSAVLAAAAHGRPLDQVLADPRVVQAVSTIERRLLDAGLLRSQQTRAAMRMAALIPAAVLALGIARIVGAQSTVAR